MAIQLFGHFVTLWTAIIWVVIGTFLAIVVNRDKFELEDREEGFKDHLKEVGAGITILAREPRVGYKI